MVLTLTELCLVALRDGIKRGERHPIHSLPVHMRHDFLRLVVMSGGINNENCVSAVGSIEFLQGMTSLDTRKGCVNDSEYLYCVANSLRSIVNGECMGDKVTSLKLNIYAQVLRIRVDDADPEFRLLCELNIDDVARLISNCPNLETLDLRYIGAVLGPDEMDETEEHVAPIDEFAIGGLLDDTGPLFSCASVLERVKEFALVVTIGNDPRYVPPFLKSGNQPIQCSNLIVLRLSCGSVDAASWNAFLNSSKETLESLHLCDIKRVGEDTANALLPFPLPRLKTFSGGNDRTLD